MTLGYQLLATACSASAVMALAWLIQRRTGDAGIVDVIWSGCLGVTALLAGVSGEGDLLRRMIVTGIAGLWSVRLTFYLLFDRVLQAEEEDGRYQMLRSSWGDSAQKWFFLFFQVQAFFVLAFSVPFYVAAGNPDPLGWMDAIGVSIWIVALAGEWVADRQLSRHRRDPENRGRTCRSGLWAYSRHPNYFFEWLHWWAYVCLSAGSVWWWLSPAAAVFMLFLLFYVTGIPYTEKRALASRGDDYREYQQQTSVFVPWFPKEARSS